MWGLPEQASAHAADIDGMISIIHWFMLTLFVIWGVFMTYCLIRFRASANPRADYKGVTGHTSTYLEAGVIIFEAFLLIGFAFPLWSKWVQEFPPRDQATVANVVGEQFAWNIHYPGPDNAFGRTDISLIDVETNPLGLDRESPEAKDDVVTLNQLNLPVNKPALLFLSAKDVIHSFKQVEMRVTQDLIPGIEIPITFTPTKTGNYEIACAQLCGIGHYRMKGFINIKEQNEFDEWMASEVEAAMSVGDEEVW